MKMLCRMCLLESENTLCIFEHDSGQFQIAPTIGRHFWFEPTKNDPISIMICTTCWSKISDFHTYYLSIEGAHRLWTEYSTVKEETEIDSVEHLKNEYVDECMDKKDDNIVKDATESTTSQTGATIDGNRPVFVDVDQGESENDLGDRLQESFDHDFRDDRPDSSSCSSDEEPLAKRVVRTRAQRINPKPEPVKDRRGRKKRTRNKPKTLDVTVPNIKVEEDSIESHPNQSISTTNDASLPAVLQNCLDVQIKEQESTCDYDQSIGADKAPQKRGGRKKKSEKLKPPDPKNPKTTKNKQCDDEISEYLKLQCELCSTPCKKFSDIKRHFRTAHNTNGYAVCCTKKFYKRVFLYEHIQKHKNPDTFKCQFCDKVYCSAQVLRSHVRTHDASYEKPYQCDICQRRFINSSFLNHHKVVHIPKEEHAFACDICDKKFPSKNIMETHKKTMHERVYSRMCHICAKVFIGRTLFEKHQLEHAGIVEPRVECEHCGMWLKNKFRLRIHSNRLHSAKNIGDHVCPICQKVSTSSEGLRSHIRYIHTERKFPCSVCDKSFKTAVALKEHMTMHTGDVLYTCPHCPKTFNSNGNMHSHRKKMHRQEWEDSRKSRGLPIT